MINTLSCTEAVDGGTPISSRNALAWVVMVYVGVDVGVCGYVIVCVCRRIYVCMYVCMYRGREE